jgi:hypothetical protein
MCFALAVAVALYAIQQYREAKWQARLAYARELTTAAASHAGTNSERSLLLALHAAEAIQSERL